MSGAGEVPLSQPALWGAVLPPPLAFHLSDVTDQALAYLGPPCVRSLVLGGTLPVARVFARLLVVLVSESCVPGDATSGSHPLIHQTLFHTPGSLPSGFGCLVAPPPACHCHLPPAHLAGIGGQFLGHAGGGLSVSSQLLSISVDAVCVLQLLLQG